MEIPGYSELPVVGKLLLFVSLLCLAVHACDRWFCTRQGDRQGALEGMTNNGVPKSTQASDQPVQMQMQMQRQSSQSQERFEVKTRTRDAFDAFYCEIYDQLVYNALKNEFEIRTIESLLNEDGTQTQVRPTANQGGKETATTNNPATTVLDLGCGTGHHVAGLCARGWTATGVDVSPSMVARAQETYPAYADRYRVGDVRQHDLVPPQSVSHLLCLYFAVYYVRDKRGFFDNCFDWLRPGGCLVLHLVDRDTFDPILPPGNPLYIVSPQKYAKERITHTKITFHDFVYSSNFRTDDDNDKDGGHKDKDKDKDVAVFEERFRFRNGRVRKQEQWLYMPDKSAMVAMAQSAGFLVHAQIDMIACAYDHQYLYVLKKPY